MWLVQKFCRFIPAVFLLFHFNAAKAGTNPSDSLKHLLKTAKGERRVDILNKMFPDLYREDSVQALKYLDEANRLSRELNYEKGKVRAGANHVYELIIKNELDAAQHQALKWLSQASALHFIDEQYDLYYYAERAYREDNQLEKAQQVLKAYLDFAKEHKNDQQTGKVYNEKGITDFYQGNLEGASEDFKLSLAHYEKINDVKEANGLTMNIGIVLYRLGKFKESLQYYNKALKAFEKLRDTLEITNALTNIAITEEAMGNFESAFASNKRTAVLYRKLKKPDQLSGVYENMGNIAYKQGNFTQALGYYFDALKIREAAKDTRRMVFSYVNISKVYVKMRDTVRAIQTVKKGLDISVKAGSLLDESICQVQVAELYIGKKMYTDARKALDRSVMLNKKIGTEPEQAATFQVLGKWHEAKNNLDSALYFYTLSYNLHQKMGRGEAAGTVLSSMGNLYLLKGKYRQAIEHLQKAEKMLKEIKAKYDLSNNYYSLAQAYAKLGQYNQAYAYYNVYHRATDSIFSSNMSRSVSEMQARYEVDKKQRENEILRQKSKVDKAELQRRETARQKERAITYGVLGVVAFCLVLLVIVIRTSVQRKKSNIKLADQNNRISEQKHIIEEKNKDITDSISYAKRIQEAILPPPQMVKECLGESFVLYQPKDIVSGDFYFVERSGNKVLFAAVDCTGHGVPGAFMSIVGHNALSKAVREYQLTEPGQVLDRLNVLVEETLDAHGSGLKDGMDISLCVMDKETGKLAWAGANNPLWIIDHKNNFTEIKPDKQPIGNFVGRKPFTSHEFMLNKGDRVYIFTDGYADQFGGPSGKKFKYSQLRDIILSVGHLSMEEQKQVLKDRIEKWRGSLEQVDDVCVIGIRI